MRQISLLDYDPTALSGVMAAVKAAMRRAAGDAEGEGRKMLTDKLNKIAKQAEIRLTGGNAHEVKKDTLDKWCSPSDVSHPPSILALLTFCAATGDYGPLRVLLRAVGLDVMTDEDRRWRDMGKADEEMEAARRRKKQAKERI